MIRFIEISDGKDVQQLTTDDLPLQVSLLIENSVNENLVNEKFFNAKIRQCLKISRIEEEQETEAIRCAYIAEDDGYLFFQPENVKKESSLSESSLEKKNKLKIFHNDELIEQSVWLKSGDILRIENKIISYVVSGDRIDIRILDRSNTTVLSPPSSDKLILNRSKINNVHKELTEENTYSEKLSSNFKKNVSRKKNNLFILLLFVLTTIAGFILLAESVSIKIEPDADKIILEGSLPVIKIGERYICLHGQYRLTANKSGYQPLEKMLKISSTNNTFAFTMQEKPGIVQFNILPDSINEVFIDNVLFGNNIDQGGEAIKYEIEKGKHRLKIINHRYKILEQIVKIEGKEIYQQFDMVLEPNWGTARISSIPDNASIKIYSESEKNNYKKNESINHKEYSTPLEIELLEDKYKVILEKEKYKAKEIPINVKAGDSLQLENIQLQPEDALLKITSKPDNSIIRIDGQYYGKTPQSIKVSPYIEHTLEVSLSAYEHQTEVFKLEPEEVKNLNVELETKTGVVYITSSPKQAKLYLDGKLQKKSSGKFTLNRKNHTLTVKAKGYKSQTKKLNASSYSKKISFHLEKIASGHSVHNNNRNINKNSTPSVSVIKKNYINSIGQEMILLQANTITMGSAKNEIGRRSNEREHKVKLSRSFYLSDKEISNKHYKQFKASHDSGMVSGQSLNTGNQPVVNITWNEAAKFSNWLSKQEGLTPFYKEINGKLLAIDLKGKNNGYRLPFEAEWSYAARGKQQKKYPWSGQYPPQTISGNFADESARSQVSVVINDYNDHYRVSAPIGSYKKNKYGFFDLGGNVSEWCQDYYAPYSGFSSSGSIELNPTGPESGNHKVVRDSSWKDSSITELRLSYRNYSKKSANDIGFRIARYAQ